MVSVSGSSGTALELPPSDVAAELLSLEADGTRGFRAFALRLAERRGHGRHGEDPTASRHQLSRGVERRSRVEDVNVLGFGWQVDTGSLERVTWITGCSHYGGYRGFVQPRKPL